MENQNKMSVRQLKNGKWLVDLRPESSPVKKRIRKTVNTKTDAKQIERKILQSAEIGETISFKKDNRTLKDLVTLWYELHGHSLKDGERRKKNLMYCCDLMGNPLARNFTEETWVLYRKNRLENGISKNTMNHHRDYFSGVFTECIRFKKWTGENPLKNIKPLVLEEKELSYLTLDQIKELLISLKQEKNAYVDIIARICLSTGSRWGEALGLTPEQISNDRITFVKTKNSKKRTVPITKSLFYELVQHTKGRSRSEKLFNNTYTFRSFASCLERCNIKLPKGQNTHVLRHTFASHFIMNGGNILTLNKILGHRTLEMTLKYSHLAPSHLSDAIEKGPLSNIE